MGQTKWLESQGELAPMYAYVMNSFTWDYQSNGVIDKKNSQLLMPCVPYLQEEVLSCIQNKNEMSFDDDLIGMCEMLTTIEAIISIGLHNEQKSNFM